MPEQCSNCKFNKSMQGYARVCDAPGRLELYKRFYYVQSFETTPCKFKVVKK